MLPFLRERARKRAAAEITPEAHKTFLKFQTLCAAWGLPSLPETKPQAIALFLGQEAKDGPDARRKLNHIATVYKKLKPAPWDDPLVLAIAEASRNDDDKKIEMH